MICNTMNRHRRQHCNTLILAIIAILFVTQLKGSPEKDEIEPNQIQAQIEDATILEGRISLRNDSEMLAKANNEETITSGWFKWLFPSTSESEFTSVQKNLPVAQSSGWMARIFGGSTIERNQTGSEDDNATTTESFDLTTPQQEYEVCEMLNGTMGYCQPMKRCVMAMPDEMHFTICHDEPENLLCCTKVTENDTVLEDKYKQYLKESVNTPEFAKGLPKHPDGHCGMTYFEKKISGVKRSFPMPKTMKNERVVEGRNAHLGEVAWMVSIYYKNLFICGGSILSDYSILTAAHCVHAKQAHANRFSIRYGSITIMNGTEIKVQNITVHPDYNPPVIYNDIAILRLRSPIKFDKNVQPICLPGKNMFGDKMVNETSYVAGFGDISFGGKAASTLQMVKLKILENRYCEKNYQRLQDASTKFVLGIKKNLICAGYKEGGKDACQGDSGGPLWMRYSGANYLIGIVSFGFKCAVPRFPGVYTTVADYHSFISSHII